MAMEPKLIPQDLKIVAILFIIFGILSAIDVLASLLSGKLDINFGVLQIPIGFGLLSLKRRWHKWAIVYMLIVLVSLILVSIWIVFTPHRPFNLDIFERKVGEAPREMVILFAAGIIILNLWMYRVLTKPSTRELFNREPFDADSGIVSLNLRDG